MASSVKCCFTLYEKEPLMRALVALGATPFTLGIGFFVTISLVLSVWAAVGGPPSVDPSYLTFFENISWSLSMLFLFPFVAGLTLQYYQAIPRLLGHLCGEAAALGAEPAELDDYLAWLRRRFNSYRLSFAFFAVTLLLNLYYFREILNKEGFESWMTDGMLFIGFSAAGRGFSLIGLYAALVQIVLIYSTFHLLWRGAVLAWGLYEFFNGRGFSVRIEPLHPDGCCGLKPIGNVAMLLNMTLFMLGLYVSLKVIDRLVVQQAPLSADIGNPIMLGAYVIVAPLLFFLPLSAAHRRMKEAKEAFILPVSRRCEALFAQLSRADHTDDGLRSIQVFAEMDKMRDSMKRGISVWPFDFRSLGAFVATIMVPLVPIVLPFLVDAIFG